ncbi:MAG: erythromycin esterase family protein [Gemmatimonadales bacterium]
MMDPTASRIVLSVVDRARRLLGSLFLTAQVAACAVPRAEMSGGLDAARTAWLRRNAHPVALRAAGFDDLRFLVPLLREKRIVQLGENAHGIREYNLVKARLVRFLHEVMDFDVLVFESDLYLCHVADRRAAEARAVSTLTGCAVGVWHTQEVLPLFEYLRATRAGPDPLWLAGMDIQPIGRHKEGRPPFLSRVVAPFDTAYAASVLRLDSTFLAVYGQGARARRAYFRSANGRWMAESYDSLGRFLAERKAARSARDATPSTERGIARQTARSMAWYIRQQAAPTMRDYVERRDQGMAENLAFIVDELFPGRKVIVWGHNFHLRHNNLAIPADTATFPNVAARTMGTWTRARYGDALYTVGLYAYQGAAADNGGHVYSIAPAPAGSLEWMLSHAGPDALFIDLSRAAETDATAWMRRPISARYNGTVPLAMIVRDQYDAVLFVRDARPRRMLY